MIPDAKKGRRGARAAGSVWCDRVRRHPDADCGALPGPRLSHRRAGTSHTCCASSWILAPPPALAGAIKPIIMPV